MGLPYGMLECRTKSLSHMIEALPFTLAKATTTTEKEGDDLVVWGFSDSFCIDYEEHTTAMQNAGLQMSRYMFPKPSLICILCIVSLYFHN